MDREKDIIQLIESMSGKASSAERQKRTFSERIPGRSDCAGAKERKEAGR